MRFSIKIHLSQDVSDNVYHYKSKLITLLFPTLQQPQILLNFSKNFTIDNYRYILSHALKATVDALARVVSGLNAQSYRTGKQCTTLETPGSYKHEASTLSKIYVQMAFLIFTAVRRCQTAKVPETALLIITMCLNA
jgi:hypothetical protein